VLDPVRAGVLAVVEELPVLGPACSPTRGRGGAARARREAAIVALGVIGVLAVVEELRQLGGLGRHLPAC
jgi:hypothetical protein